MKSKNTANKVKAKSYNHNANLPEGWELLLVFRTAVKAEMAYVYNGGRGEYGIIGFLESGGDVKPTAVIPVQESFSEEVGIALARFGSGESDGRVARQSTQNRAERITELKATRERAAKAERERKRQERVEHKRKIEENTSPIFKMPRAQLRDGTWNLKVIEKRVPGSLLEVVRCSRDNALAFSYCGIDEEIGELYAITVITLVAGRIVDAKPIVLDTDPLAVDDALQRFINTDYPMLLQMHELLPRDEAGELMNVALRLPHQNYSDDT